MDLERSNPPENVAKCIPGQRRGKDDRSYRRSTSVLSGSVRPSRRRRLAFPAGAYQRHAPKRQQKGAPAECYGLEIPVGDHDVGFHSPPADSPAAACSVLGNTAREYHHAEAKFSSSDHDQPMTNQRPRIAAGASCDCVHAFPLFRSPTGWEELSPSRAVRCRCVRDVLGGLPQGVEAQRLRSLSFCLLRQVAPAPPSGRGYLLLAASPRAGSSAASLWVIPPFLGDAGSGPQVTCSISPSDIGLCSH